MISFKDFAPQVAKKGMRGERASYCGSNIGDVFVTGQFDLLMPDRKELFTKLLVNSDKILDDLIVEKDKFGIDIEWKIMNENGVLRLYFKQARPLNLQVGH